MNEETNNDDKQIFESMLNLGAWLGRHQAFGLIANRCSAADAECLKAIRDSGEYKRLGLTWEQFCTKHAGVSRVHADRQIHYFEEFGGNYHRLLEVMPISPGTYRLIAAAVTDDGLEFGGEHIPLTRENRERLAAALLEMGVGAKREPRAHGGAEIGGVRKRLDALLAEALAVANQADRRVELIGLLEEAHASLERLAHELRERTLVLA